MDDTGDTMQPVAKVEKTMMEITLFILHPLHASETMAIVANNADKTHLTSCPQNYFTGSQTS